MLSGLHCVMLDEGSCFTCVNPSAFTSVGLADGYLQFTGLASTCLHFNIMLILKWLNLNRNFRLYLDVFIQIKRYS